MGIFSYMKSKVLAALALVSTANDIASYVPPATAQKCNLRHYQPKIKVGKAGDKLARKAQEGSIGCPNGRVY